MLCLLWFKKATYKCINVNIGAYGPISNDRRTQYLINGANL